MKIILNKFFLKNKKGLTILEAIPFILITFTLIGAVLGSWGIVHTSILYSISARHGNFKMFNNRSDLSYLRDYGSDMTGEAVFFRNKGWRFSFIQSTTPVGDNEPKMTATARFVDFTNIKDDGGQVKFEKGAGTTQYDDPHGDERFLTNDEHNKIQDFIPDDKNQRRVAPAWIMVGYGICLNAKCGDN